MLTKLIIHNFKRFDHVEIDLGNPVIFIGPNNSGKTTALQALALWDMGLRRWREKRLGKTAPEQRSGVTINRRDFVSLPVPDANLLWRDLRVRKQKANSQNGTENIRIDIIVEGITNGEAWQCGFEFDYANEESFYCRPLRITNDLNQRMPVPEAAYTTKVAFLPPMSGLAANELRLDVGAINVRIGEGRTAEVLRNLCYSVYQQHPEQWQSLIQHIHILFGVTLNPPVYISERGEIVMDYKTNSGRNLDLSTSGRGLQQMLLLLTYLMTNPKTVLLLDEPDAHLEILRQRQLYNVLNDLARINQCQIVAASHSEIILNEAADRDVVVAFVGKPHRIDDRSSTLQQVAKSLKELGFDQYYQAEQKGWVLYIEGSTDLEILRSLAQRLNHPAKHYLEQPFVHFINANQPQKARDHFYGLREAKANLVGICILDRVDKVFNSREALHFTTWSKREIENYICYPESIQGYIRDFFKEESPGQLENIIEKLDSIIQELEKAFKLLNGISPWDDSVKVSDQFLNRVFEHFFSSINISNLLRKTDFHRLVPFVPFDKIDPEITQKLNLLVEVAQRAVIDETE
ncbi:MAG: AAA family ATPase [Chloroflexi bacterium]|nr:AAA family ATPase [Chloroflexota bacterium]